MSTQPPFKSFGEFLMAVKGASDGNEVDPRLVGGDTIECPECKNTMGGNGGLFHCGNCGTWVSVETGTAMGGVKQNDTTNEKPNRKGTQD